MASINRKIERNKAKLNPLTEIVKMVKEAKALIAGSIKPEEILNELKFNIAESEDTKDDIKYVNGIITTIKNTRNEIKEIIQRLEEIMNIKKPKENEVLDAVDDVMRLGEKSLILEKAISDTYTIFQSLEKEINNEK